MSQPRPLFKSELTFRELYGIAIGLMLGAHAVDVFGDKGYVVSMIITSGLVVFGFIKYRKGKLK